MVNNKSISDIIPKGVKKWLISLAMQYNFDELRSSLECYLEDIHDETMVTRMEKTMCSNCGKLGVRVELIDCFNRNKKMLCKDCFDSI